MNKDMFTEARPLMKDLSILNVYQINLFQIMQCMYKLKNEKIPQVFKTQFFKIQHRYPTRYSTNNYVIPRTTLRKTDFAITCRGPSLWNKVLPTEMKDIKSLQCFKSQLKQHLLNTQNETNFF